VPVPHWILPEKENAYLDDILIYSDTIQEHQVHVKQVLQALSKASCTSSHRNVTQLRMYSNNLLELIPFIFEECSVVKIKRISPCEAALGIAHFA